MNSLRGVECTDHEKESRGSWRHRQLVQQHTDFGLGGSRQGYSQALNGSVLLPSTTPAWRKQGANGFSVPPLVSRDVGSP